MRMPVYNLEWAEPPAADDAIKQGILAQLQANPGRWACIVKDRSSTTMAADWMKLGTEARAVRNNPQAKPPRYDIYVRWPSNKPPTVSNAVREAAAKASALNGSTGVKPIAHTPPPVGGYLSQRAARGIPEGGNPV